MNPKNKRFKVYLMRHGQIRSEKRLVGQLDLPLTEEGTRQARWWNEKLQGLELAAIYCSDLSRCLRFAQIIAGARTDLIAPMEGLREIRLGHWEGLTSAEAASRYPEDWRERGAHPGPKRPPGGESFQDLKERVIPAFERLVERAESDIMIVAHGGVNRMILLHLLGAPLDNVFRLAQDFACLNLIEFDGPAPRVRIVNMTPELDGKCGFLEP